MSKHTKFGEIAGNANPEYGNKGLGYHALNKDNAWIGNSPEMQQLKRDEGKMAKLEAKVAELEAKLNDNNHVGYNEMGVAIGRPALQNGNISVGMHTAKDNMRGSNSGPFGEQKQ